MPNHLTKQDYKNWLQHHNLDAYILPLTDPFQSEYVPPAFNRVHRLSGFTGSSATIVLTKDSCCFFTDSRYIIQAKQQLDETWKIINSHQQKPTDYLCLSLPPKSIVGYDPELFSATQTKAIHKSLKNYDLSFFAHHINCADELLDLSPWENIPCTELFIHDIQYCGTPSLKKRHQVMATIFTDFLLVTDPCSVAWLMNIRAFDLPCTPIPLAWALLCKDGHCDIFLEKAHHRIEKIKNTCTQTKFHTLRSLEEHLQSLPSSATITVDPCQISQKLFSSLEKYAVTQQKNPCLHLKSVKNKTEEQGMKACHIRDGLALSYFLFWLEKETKGRTDLNEIGLADKLFSYRQSDKLFIEPSFPTISGIGPNSAIIHYQPSSATNRTLSDGDIYLVDSGGQYFDGTTDVTRTVYFGHSPPTQYQKEMYTRVLKGHIGIAKLIFPKGTYGHNIDVLARQSLWQIGKSYGHGTGHGVGYLSNVHEAPPSISMANGSEPLAPGMVLSNEPGYYEESLFGIRLENLMLIQETKLGEDNAFMKFEQLTVVPFDKRLIEKKLLTFEEINWLNLYHSQVEASLLPKSCEDITFTDWLRRACSPL